MGMRYGDKKNEEYFILHSLKILYFPYDYVKSLSLLSDSNQRPRDYKSRALAN